MTIKITPQELRDAASFLEGKRNEIVDAVRLIKEKVDSATADWSGASQSTFIENFNEMVPMLTESFPQVVEGIEAQLSGAADGIEGADAEIAKAFKG